METEGKPFAGVDIGSVTAKAIIILNGAIAASAHLPTKVNSEKSGSAVLEMALQRANMRREDLRYVVATGYGRISAPFADATVTEIGCHARGVYWLNPGVGTVIDMGGQDCKCITIGERGQVEDFTLSDKCAAGTGRFLEVLARVFDATLEELGPLCLRATERIPITSTCTVFAETEVVSLMAKGERPENIVSGVHYSIARRVAGLVSRTGIKEEVVFTGGVAKNVGMKKTLAEVLNIELTELNGDPLFTGALGAALIAQSRGG